MKLKILILFAAFTCGFVHAQDVPPPPKPQDSGPSIDVTMKFIQEKLQAVGLLEFIDYTHFNETGKDAKTDYHRQITNVRADASNCRLDYHYHVKFGNAEADEDHSFLLKDVQELAVQNDSPAIDSTNASRGILTTTRIDPPVFLVKVELANKQRQLLYFFDESMANRVAKAMVHAVELCGGGNKDPF